MSRPVVTIHEPVARAAFATWHSADAHVAEVANRLVGDNGRAIFWRTRSVIAWDHALRNFDRLREEAAKP